MRPRVAVPTDPPRAAVITGYGVVSPLGVGVPAFWKRLAAGERAVAPAEGFAADDLAPRSVAEVRAPGFDDPDRAGAFALVAAREALAAAELEDRLPGRTGVALGTTLGGMRLFERWSMERGGPGIERVPYFAPGVTLARALGCAGPVATTQLACASGTHALALAASWIARGRCPVVLAGGTDLLCRFVVAGFNALRATDAEARPFDRARRGLVLGEGAAVLIVEDAEHALRRGARVRGSVLGTGAAGDAVHMTAPDRDGGGAARAMAAALAAAGVEPEAVGFVSAHGTGTPYNDAMEAVALGRVFGARTPPVNSIKGAIGHTLGAAGAFEAVACLQTMATGLVPPTAGLEHVDPACGMLDLVIGTARRAAVRTCLSTSSGFAGANAAIVLGHP